MFIGLEVMSPPRAAALAPALASGMRSRFMLVAAIVALAPAGVLRAQATVTVPVQDPVYRDLDRLFGSGLIKTMIVGQRPYSRREIARMVIDASQSPSRRPMSERNQRTLERLQREYAPEIGVLKGDT